MKTPLYKRYADRRPVGAVCICNTFGMLVFEPMGEDKLDTDFVTAWSGLEGQAWGYHRNKVHYTAAGRGYLRKGSMRFYLDDIVRV